MKKAILTTPLFLFLILNMSGQDYLSFLEESAPGEGSITIEHSDEIGEMLEKHIYLNEKNKTIPGYRIKIYSDNNKNAREESLEAKNKFLDNFSDIPVYRQYVTPYFRIYVGNFRTKTDALKKLKEVKQYFRDAYIVSVHIDLPKIE